ncbi:hypothetical protein FO519_004485 [Halicephalobus sp. NKZ332]|nr:hypothetical protein FO519_004485 [Halicephalobus sp. NKZ332]
MSKEETPSVEVSVVIPVKDGEQYIEECLRSILNQENAPSMEVSIYNDGSTDGTLSIIEKLIPEFTKAGIEIVYKSGETAGGVGFAKNKACRQSHGKFLCFLDSDDVMKPNRVRMQYEAALATEDGGSKAFIGSQFVREPEGSTVRYTKWACGLSKNELREQIYTAFGPTLIAPTWFLSRNLFDRVGGFNENHVTGYPEDLDFFYKAVPMAVLEKVEETLVIYRWHPGCATFIVDEKTIWKLRIAELEKNILPHWETITIWNAGKHGKRFYKSLSPVNQKKVIAFCDVAVKKIAKRYMEIYDETNRKVLASIPIIHQKFAKPPTVLCVKLDMTDGKFEEYLDEKKWRESIDYNCMGKMTNELDVFFCTALELVKKSGNVVRAAYEQPIAVVKTKSSNTDLVTETDQAVEKLLINGLSEAFPDHKFIGEESAAAGQKYTLTDAPTWIIDPIDGTTNFVHRIPLVGICVGLTIKKEPVIGIVYNPISNEIFTAIKGRGAFKNGFPIHVSDSEELSKAVICTSLGIHNLVSVGPLWLDTALDNHRKSVLAGVRGTPEMVNSYIESFKAFMVDHDGHGHRAFGSAAINMVYCAQGSIDAYIEYGLHSWDIAAAVVILREAGGSLIDPSGEPFDLMARSVLCAGTEKLAREISVLFTHTKFEREGEEDAIFALRPRLMMATATTGNNGLVKSEMKTEAPPTFEEVNNVTKEVLDNIIGQNSYQHTEAVKWNQQVVEGITMRLADLNRPYKYCVSCVIMQTGLGAGLNVASTCFWDKTTDQSYSLRWDNKAIVAVLSVFAVNYA